MGPRKATLVAAALTLALALLGLVVFPYQAELSGGWRTPILAFELARTPADLGFLMGADAGSVRAGMYLGHRVDVFFPLAYGSLLALGLAEERGRLRWVGVVAAVLAVPFDWYENHVLLGLLRAIEGGEDVSSGLQQLGYATWAKWGAIGAALGVLSVVGQSLWYRIPAGVACVATLLAYGSGARPWLGEQMGLWVAAAFAALAFKRLWDARRSEDAL